MLSSYLEKKMDGARYRLLRDKSYFGEIPGLRGVWANSRTLEGCRKELQEVLEDWLLLKVQARERVPGFAVKTDRRRLVRHG